MSSAVSERIGPYRVAERLSERSVKARTAGGREFVLKHVGPAGSSAGAVGRYARAREIMHPSLANVVGVEDHGGERYLIYQFVKGLAVDEWIMAKRPSRAAIARLVRDAAETLDYIHKQGVVHGNPRAGNLIVSARGDLRVVDISPDPVADPVVDVRCLGELLKGALAAGGSGASDDLDRIIERATGGAYPNARAMAEDLRDYCEGRALRRVSIRRGRGRGGRSASALFLRTEFLAGIAVLAGAGAVFGVLLAVLGNGAKEGEVVRPPTAPEAPPAGVTPEGGEGEEDEKPAKGAVAVAPPGKPGASIPTAGAEATRPEPDGLEAAPGWAVLEWGNPAEVTVMQEGDDRTLLVRSPAGGSKDKAAVHRAMEVDLSGKRAVKLRVENGTARRVAFAFAVTTKEGYFEALPVMLRPGWNEDVSFELRERIYKAESTQWKHETAVGDPSSVTDVYFIVYNGGTAADVRLDAIRFE